MKFGGEGIVTKSEKRQLLAFAVHLDHKADALERFSLTQVGF